MPITAILLAAGYATRLYPLTTDRPKTLLPFGRGTILDEIMASLAGVPDVHRRVLVTNHRFAGQFQEWQRTCGAEVRILDDRTDTPETRLGAIRDLELAKTQAGPTDDLLVLGTDNLFRWSLAAFVGQAQRHSPAPTIALWQASSAAAATQFGVVVRDRTDRVTEFVEKSPTPPSRDVALCVYYFPSAMCGSIRTFLDSGENADAPGYLIQWLARRSAVYGVMMPGAWYDIGTFEAYEAARKAWMQDEVRGVR